MHTNRPTRGRNLWLFPVLVPLTILLLALVTGSDVAGTTALVLTVGGTMIATGTTVWTIQRARRQSAAFESRLTDWAGERAVRDERLRIARDLHDLVSHGLGTVTVRASAAARAQGPGRADEQATALADIEEVGRRTTTELRRMLTVLRAGDHATAPVHPAETLRSLPEIAHEAEERGAEVTLDLPDPGPVSPGAQLTLCAIVREALDNTARHAGPTRARVEVHRLDDTLRVTVIDQGPEPGWRPFPGAGHGLIGLRERVRALGGTLRSGSEGPGSALTAHLPDGEGR